MRHHLSRAPPPATVGFSDAALVLFARWPRIAAGAQTLTNGTQRMTEPLRPKLLRSG